MTKNELTRLLQSEDPNKVKKALQHIRILISEQKKLCDDILIVMLQSNLKVVYNTALKYLIRQKQKSVFLKLRVPPQLEKDAIFNHACYELWRYVRKYDFDTSTEGAIERFLYIVCKRYISRNSGNIGRFEEMPELPDNPPPRIYKADAYELLGKLFNLLGKGCKEILVPKYLEGKKFKEIAEEVDSSEGSVKVTSSRCMGKLRKWIDEDPNLGNFIRDLLN